MKRLVIGTFVVLAAGLTLRAAPQTRQLGKQVASLLSVNAPVVAIAHATLIDGTGAPARNDQTVVVSDGKITAVVRRPAWLFPRARRSSMPRATP